MANIFQAYLQPPRSVADYTAEFDRQEMGRLQLEGQRGQNALTQLTRQQQAQAARQAMAEQNALQRIAQEAGGDPERLIGGLRGSGMPGLMTRADALEKGALDRKKVTADVGKTEAETAAKVAESRYIAADRLARELAFVQTPQDIADYAEKTLDLFGAQGPQREQAKQQMLARAQQMGLAAWKQAAEQQAIPLLDKFKQDAEMKRAQLSSATQMRGQDLSAQTARAGHAVTMRGQDMVNARTRERLAVDQGTAVADAGGLDQAALSKRLGKPSPGYRWKADGSQEAIPGGPADRKANEQLAGKETVDNVVASLRSAYDSLDTGGGITSTKRGLTDNLTAAASRSTVGQAVGGALGTKNQKERDSIAQARPLLLQAIMKATGMSAKQMDSNAELKLYLATATDPKLTLEANREALDRIEQLYGSGAKPQATPTTPNKAIKRTGTSNGRKVVEYTDGSIAYVD